MKLKYNYPDYIRACDIKGLTVFCKVCQSQSELESWDDLKEEHQHLLWSFKCVACGHKNTVHAQTIEYHARGVA